MPTELRVEIEGLDELNAAFGNVSGARLVQELGAVQRTVGTLVVQRAGGPQTGVGEGFGSAITTVPRSLEVELDVGGAHRADFGRWRQWGVRQVWPPPRRPYLIGAAIAATSDIDNAYLDGIARAAEPLKLER